MKILITGGTGYLGSNLIKSFLHKQHKILCIKLPDSDMSFISDVERQIEFVDTDNKVLEKVIYDFMPEVAIHTAGLYERNNIGLFQLMDANFTFPLKILDICIRSGIKQWVNTNTALPFYFNRYSLLKHQFSEWGRFFVEKGDISFVNLQLEHFYGPNAPQHNFISWVIRKLMNNERLELTTGQQRRDFVYIKDIIEIYNRILTLNIENYCDIEVGTGFTSSIVEIVEFLREITDSSSDIQYGAIPLRSNEPNSDANLSMLNSLGLECPTHWKVGLKEMIERDML